MIRELPGGLTRELERYVTTYRSLLQGGAEMPVRAVEEAHVRSESCLHPRAAHDDPDVDALAYSAARLPSCIGRTRRVLLGTSHEQFESAGFDVRAWEEVSAPGRRRSLRWDGTTTLAAFLTNASDLDDLIPILTAYQVEWNKLHRLIAGGEVNGSSARRDAGLEEAASAVLGRAAFAAVTRRPLDLRVRLLGGSWLEYQCAANRWWCGVERAYLRDDEPKRRPVYFVSSNTHAITNLIEDRSILGDTGDPERSGMEANLAYYLRRSRANHLAAASGAGTVRTVERPGGVPVPVQMIELSKLQADQLDPRVRVPGLAQLGASDAVLINIDYPLGLGAYHHLARLAQGVGEIRGIFVMGKAATMNGSVGDVMAPSVVHDEHSQNTFVFNNSLAASDVAPWVEPDTGCLDGQRALSVLSPVLQSEAYLAAYHRHGYAVVEMEAGPYLSAVFEIGGSKRVPTNEIVEIPPRLPFEVGILHYAADTPIARRGTTLSKRLGLRGVAATYGCAIAIMRRVLTSEVARLEGAGSTPAEASTHLNGHAGAVDGAPHTAAGVL